MRTTENHSVRRASFEFLGSLCMVFCAHVRGLSNIRTTGASYAGRRRKTEFGFSRNRLSRKERGSYRVRESGVGRRETRRFDYPGLGQHHSWRREGLRGCSAPDAIFGNRSTSRALKCYGHSQTRSPSLVVDGEFILHPGCNTTGLDRWRSRER